MDFEHFETKNSWWGWGIQFDITATLDKSENKIQKTF